MADTPPRPRRLRGCLPVLLLLSLAANAVLCGVTFWPHSEADGPDVVETHLYGRKREGNKIAVVRAEGVLVERLDAHILRQIEKAGRDPKVRAVVLRIDSPGGTITSSEAIHRELTRLKAGTHPRHSDWSAKPVVASMGSMAASGGYYIAMPAEKVFAETDTTTGSIGVYASFPNVAELANKHGVRWELVKAGGIKNSGSPFHAMTPQERQPWQDLVDSAYTQFLGVVAAGRPGLTVERLRTEVVRRQTAGVYDDKGNPVADEAGRPKQVAVERYRADGGTFTAADAKAFGLIDEVGLLEDAVAAAAAAAGVGEYRVVVYERPAGLLDSLLGIRAPTAGGLDLGQLSAGLTPRLWYLTPQCDLGGVLAAAAASPRGR